MPKPFLPTTTLLLFTLAAMMACTGATPTPNATETPAPTSIAATTPVPANTRTLEARSTPVPTPEPTPTEGPTAGPNSTLSQEPTASPTPDRRLAPLPHQDSQALQAALSDAELSCISDDPEELARALAGYGTTSPEEYARRLGCLTDGTSARLFLTGLVPGPDPLSLEASNCVREAFGVIYPREVMSAGTEGDPGRAMAGGKAALVVALACLTDEEWRAVSPEMEMGPEEQAELRCLMEELGGPGQMAKAAMASQEFHFTTYDTPEAALAAAEEADATLEAAVAACEMKMGPRPGQAVKGPTPVPTSTTTPAASTPTATTTLIITVAEVPAGIPEYDRGQWKHWVDEDGDCQDARQEVLVEESLITVTYETDRQCRVESGRWWAPYLEHHLGNPRHIDVDHTVPLRNAHLSGAWAWSSEEKEDYANYLDDPAHLVAISSRHNRGKGARGPEEWAPPDNMLWCDYATDWAEIKQRWDLTMTPVESEIVMDMLETCEDPPKYEVEVLTGTMVVPGTHKPVTETTVYASCEEAAEAGEERVQGSRGGGRGFPAEMVPSARDGDGDGVVCER